MVIGRWFAMMTVEGQAAVATIVTLVFFWMWLTGLCVIPWVMIPVTIFAVGFTASGGGTVLAYLAYHAFISFFTSVREQVILNQISKR